MVFIASLTYSCTFLSSTLTTDISTLYSYPSYIRITHLRLTFLNMIHLPYKTIFLASIVFRHPHLLTYLSLTFYSQTQHKRTKGYMGTRLPSFNLFSKIYLTCLLPVFAIFVSLLPLLSHVLNFQFLHSLFHTWGYLGYLRTCLPSPNLPAAVCLPHMPSSPLFLVLLVIFTCSNASYEPSSGLVFAYSILVYLRTCLPSLNLPLINCLPSLPSPTSFRALPMTFACCSTCSDIFFSPHSLISFPQLH